MVDKNNLKYINNTILSVDIDLKRKQPCCIDGCSNNSFSRFILTDNLYQKQKYFCCQCTSVITGFNLFQLGIAEQYVMLVKPHFEKIKNKIDYHSIYNHINNNVTGRLVYNIGNFPILITEFNHKSYGLIINGKQYQRDLRKYFTNFKQVYDSTVSVINNKYIDMILNYLYCGVSFVMP